jgi:hypothetical protein
MKIIIRPFDWAVIAEWHGVDRVVYTSPNIFACIRFVVENR